MKKSLLTDRKKREIKPRKKPESHTHDQATAIKHASDNPREDHYIKLADIALGRSADPPRR